MSEEEIGVRMRALRQRVVTRDVHQWAQSFLDSLAGAASPEQERVVLSSREDLDALAARLRSAEALLLMLDYDGTLVPFSRVPDLAGPDNGLRDLLQALAERPGVRVHLVSGRRRETMDRWLGALPIGLHAEHGYWSRLAAGQPWVALEDADLTWKPGVRRIMEQACVETAGALVEEKTASLAWHWRMADPEFGAVRAQELWHRLEEHVAGAPVELLRGQSVIEARPRGVNKGRVVDRVLAVTPRPLPTIVAVGDDWTDEDLFRAVPPEAATIGVGFRSSSARYRVARPSDVRLLLARILGDPPSVREGRRTGGYV
jgi:trehalose 6-phosphate synthase/phosphatase